MRTRATVNRSSSVLRRVVTLLAGLASVGLPFSMRATSPTPRPDSMAAVSQVPSKEAPLSEWQDWAVAQRSVMIASGHLTTSYDKPV